MSFSLFKKKSEKQSLIVYKYEPSATQKVTLKKPGDGHLNDL